MRERRGGSDDGMAPLNGRTREDVLRHDTKDYQRFCPTWAECGVRLARSFPSTATLTPALRSDRKDEYAERASERGSETPKRVILSEAEAERRAQRSRRTPAGRTNSARYRTAGVLRLRFAPTFPRRNSAQDDTFWSFGTPSKKRAAAGEAGSFPYSRRTCFTVSEIESKIAAFHSLGIFRP